VPDLLLLKRLLGGLNVLLGGGLLLFSYQYLVKASEGRLDLASDEVPRTVPVRPQDSGDGALKSLSNPLEKRASRSAEPARFGAVLKGTLACEKDPSHGVAFIKSTPRGAELVAYVGEEILLDGRPCEELRGWILVSVTKDRALFRNRRGDVVELSIDPSAAAVPAASAPAKPPPAAASYAADAYKSRLLASSDNREVWGMDAAEIEWAAQNLPQILDRDFQIVPFVGGGLRLEGVTPGSIGAARGLLAGDVLREVNGRPLQSLADLRTLGDDPGAKSQATLRLTIERAGKPMVIEYRPLPR
jgi:hypothetical protein